METIASAEISPAIKIKRNFISPGPVISAILLIGRSIVEAFSDDITPAYLERERHLSRAIIYSGMPGT